MSRDATQKSGVPQIIKSDVALKLAEQWVNNMTKVAVDEQTEAGSEGRPSRLGLGAKFSRQMRLGPSNDPVERKLYANLQSGKRKAAKDAEESSLTARDPGGDSDIDDELESRASVFAKKRDLQSLTSKEGVSLVLCGASGLSEELIKGFNLHTECIARGVRKFNVNTRLRKAYMECLSEPQKDLIKVVSSAKEAMKAAVAEKMHLFGSAGKA